MRFTVNMQHDATSIRRLSKTQYQTFGKLYQAVQLAMSIAFLAVGLSGRFGQVASMLMLMLGCWLFVSLEQIPKFRADKILREYGQKFPATSYTFEDNRILLEGGKKKIATMEYQEIIRLVEDDEYAYLFVSRESAYMIPYKALKPHDAEAFKKLVEQKTGLAFLRSKSLLMTTRGSMIAGIRQAWQGRKNEKANDHQELD